MVFFSNIREIKNPSPRASRLRLKKEFDNNPVDAPLEKGNKAPLIPRGDDEITLSKEKEINSAKKYAISSSTDIQSCKTLRRKRTIPPNFSDSG